METFFQEILFNRKKASIFSCVIALTLLISFSCIAQSAGWVQKQALYLSALPRTDAVGFSIGNKGYIGLGSNQKDFWEFDPVTNVWTQKADYPGAANTGAVGFSIGGKGFVGTGPAQYDFWEFDPVSNNWTQKANVPGGIRTDAVGFSISGKGYIGTGSDKTGPTILFGYKYKNDFFEYDPAADAWTKKSDFPGSARTNAIGINIGNKGYVGLGLDSAGLQNDFWCYDPAKDAWNKKADFPWGARYGAAGFGIGGFGYVGTGSTYPYGNGLERNNNDFYQYDTASDSWSANIGFPGVIRVNAVGFSIGNKGYIGTGEINQDIPNPPLSRGSLLDFYEFDPSGFVWTKKANLGGGTRFGAVGFSIGGKGYLGTGGDLANKNDFWEYDTSTNAWSQKADLPAMGRVFATGFSIGNKGYIGGGFNGGVESAIGWLNDFWEYDPDLNSWNQKAFIPGLSRQNAAGFSIGNKGYVGTGIYRAAELSDFWEYDPATNLWTRKADFGGGVASNASGFSIGSKGYMCGGESTIGFWEYDTTANTWTQRANLANGSGLFKHGFSIGNKGYGFTGNGVQVYDPATDTWTKTVDFPDPDGAGVAFSIGNKGYAGFGNDNHFWEFTPAESGIETIVTTNSFCSSSPFPVQFFAFGVYNPDNIFTAQLSDSSGNFANPLVIGSVSATSSDTIQATIPNNIRPGSAYRIRVVSSSPATTGSDNGINLTIGVPILPKAQNKTIYLNADGQASLSPEDITSGSLTYCTPLNLSLDKSTFDCSTLGINPVVLTASDGNGMIVRDTVQINVLDTIPPVVSNVSLRLNRPENLHAKQNMILTINFQVADNCATPGISLSVSGNNTQNSNGPGWTIIDNHHILLDMNPANPWTGNSGRQDKIGIYLFSITATDASGNKTTTRLKFPLFPVFLNSRLPELIWPNESVDSMPMNLLPEDATIGLMVRTMPNPTRNYFSLIIQSNSNQGVTVLVTDLLGRIVESRTNVSANGTIQLGHEYSPGTYFLKIIQGDEQKTVKLIKQ
jgi:N-acetylneuraminic acid mutarotase